MSEIIYTSHGTNTVTGGEYLSGTIMEDDGTPTPFTIISDNPGFGLAKVKFSQYENANQSLASNPSNGYAKVRLERASKELLDAVHNAINLATKINNDINRFASLGLPIKLMDGHFYVEMNGSLEPIDPVLEKKMIEASKGDDADSKENWGALSAFITRLYSNTTRYVREQLFSWLTANFDDDGSHGFTLMPDGRFIGYKGCMRDADDNIVSINTGTAISDGVTYNGHIPNKVGCIVEMARGNVEDNPSVGCSTGLHVGTWGYASAWAQGVVLRVAVAPEDVVSIPVDCNYQKLRACRYEVLETTNVPINDTVYGYCHTITEALPPFTLEELHDRLDEFEIDINPTIAFANGDDVMGMVHDRLRKVFSEYFSKYPEFTDDEVLVLVKRAKSIVDYADSYDEAVDALNEIGLELRTDFLDGVYERAMWKLDDVEEAVSSAIDECDSNEYDEDDYDILTEQVNDVLPSFYPNQDMPDDLDDLDKIQAWVNRTRDGLENVDSLYEVYTKFSNLIE